MDRPGLLTPSRVTATLVLLTSLSPLAGATAQVAPLVYPGATVRVLAPALGTQAYLGRFATARVRGTVCLGAAVTLPGSAGSASLVLLKGITRLEVDRRTNIEATAIGLGEPAAGDWETIDLAALRTQDSTCAVRATPGS